MEYPVYKCPDCPKAFRRIQHLQSHSRSAVHLNEINDSANSGGSGSAEKKNTRWTAADVISSNRKFLLEQARQKGRAETVLSKTQKNGAKNQNIRDKPNMRNFKCNYCPADFYHRSSLSRHHATHTILPRMNLKTKTDSIYQNERETALNSVQLHTTNEAVVSGQNSERLSTPVSVTVKNAQDDDDEVSIIETETEPLAISENSSSEPEVIFEEVYDPEEYTHDNNEARSGFSSPFEYQERVTLCPVCHEVFSIKNFQSHIQKHKSFPIQDLHPRFRPFVGSQGERFSCKYCPKRYAKLCKLLEHEYLHAGRPFKQMGEKQVHKTKADDTNMEGMRRNICEQRQTQNPDQFKSLSPRHQENKSNPEDEEELDVQVIELNEEEEKPEDPAPQILNVTMNSQDAQFENESNVAAETEMDSVTLADDKIVETSPDEVEILKFLTKSADCSVNSTLTTISGRASTASFENGVT